MIDLGTFLTVAAAFGVGTFFGVVGAGFVLIAFLKVVERG